MAMHERLACSADDEAALDRLTERALAEESALEQETTSGAEAGGVEPLDAKAFLAEAAAFLRPRADRAALIERLRALVIPGQDAAQSLPAKEAKPE